MEKFRINTEWMGIAAGANIVQIPSLSCPKTKSVKCDGADWDYVYIVAPGYFSRLQ
jgi:hypothetical protein